MLKKSHGNGPGNGRTGASRNGRSSMGRLPKRSPGGSLRSDKQWGTSACLGGLRDAPFVESSLIPVGGLFLTCPRILAKQNKEMRQPLRLAAEYQPNRLSELQPFPLACAPLLLQTRLQSRPRNSAEPAVTSMARRLCLP